MSRLPGRLGTVQADTGSEGGRSEGGRREGVREEGAREEGGQEMCRR